jgi:hypothetical protein
MQRAAFMLTAAIGAAAMTALAQPPAEKTPAPPLVDDVESALERKTNLVFRETPLQNVIQFIAEQHNVRIHLDDAGLGESNVDRDVQTNIALQGVRLATALDLMLAPHNLDHYIHDSVLVVTSQDRASDRRDVKIHRIGDLTPDGDSDMDPLTDLIRSCVDRDAWTPNGGENEIRYVPEARSFVVTAPDRLQRKIRQLLTDLRQAKRANGMP